jgi:hypothetical protein
MKKIILLLTAVFCLTSFSYSQEFYFGLKSGLKKEVYEIPGNYGIYNTQIDFLAPTITSSFKILYPSNFEIGWGFGHYSYSQKIRVKDDFLFLLHPIDFQTGSDLIYRAFSFHFQMGYNLKIIQNFYFKFNTGFEYAMYFSYREIFDTNVIATGDPSMVIHYTGLSNYQNLLLTNSISLQCFIKQNFGISIFGAYHAGLFPVSNNAVIYKTTILGSTYSYWDNLYSQGSYFEFGIELGYKLPKKNE